jgi:hypothetical protein
MGNVIFVLAVVAFWLFVFLLMMVLIRMAAGAHDDEQTACDVPEDYYNRKDNSAALT